MEELENQKQNKSKGTKEDHLVEQEVPLTL